MSPAERPTPPGPASVFLVSAGGRGITARCVVTLAERFGCAFALLGRSQRVESEPAWAGDCADEAELKRRIADDLRARGERPLPASVQRAFDQLSASREIAATLAAVEQVGGRAIYLQADVADLDVTRRAVTAAEASLGPIDGLIHGAGSLADRLIEQKTAADFSAVFRPKVDGLANLLRCVPPRQLRRLVLFSSAAAYYGNPGQSDYALANRALDQAARALARAHPSCQVLALNWGPWDGGMVSPALGRLFRERGLDLISPAAGAQLLADLLTDPQPGAPVQLVVGGPLARPSPPPASPPARGPARLRRRLTLADNPFLLDHVLDGRPTLPLAAAIAWLGNAAEQLWPGLRLARVEDCQVLKGIVLDGPPDQPLDLVLELRASARQADTVWLEAELTSQEPPGPARPRYRARLALTPGEPAGPTLEAFDRTGGPAAREDGAVVYRDGTLFHGPRFQGVRRWLEASERRLALECVLDAVSTADQGQFPARSCNPFALDLAFQALAVWSRLFRGAASLPARVGALEQYRPPKWGERFVVAAEVRSASDELVAADVVLHDPAGRILSRLSGVEHAVSPHLNERFLRNQLSQPDHV